MAAQQTTSRKKEEIEKELACAKNLLETARSNFAYKSQQIKDLELRIKNNEQYLKDMPSNTTANNKVAGERSRYERVQAEIEHDKKRLEELKTQKKQLGKEVANKRYYVNRLNNELTLPFKEVKKQVKEDSEKGNKAKKVVRSRKKVQEKAMPEQNKEAAKEVKTQETVKPISLDGIAKVDLTQKPNMNDVKLKIKPTVTLVPHIKRNGKPSKRNFDIQLMDADGKIFTVTKKMADKMFKKDLDNGKKDAYMWPTYIQACKEGRVTPEFLEEKFFKGQVNLGDTKTTEVKKEETKTKMPEIQLEEVTIADTGGKGAYDGMNTTSSGMPMNNEVNIPGAATFVNTGKSVEVTEEELNKLSAAVKAAEAEAKRQAANEAYAKKLENSWKEQPIQEGVKDPSKKEKIEETTVDVQKAGVAELPKDEQIEGFDPVAMQQEAQNTKQTRTTTPEGITYSFDNAGRPSVSGGIRVRDFEYLMPGYESENSSKQIYGVEAKVTQNHTYKDSEGYYHCGGSKGTIRDSVRVAEEKALESIVKNNAVYSDLKRESVKRNLSEPEKKFMKNHEAMLQERGLIRCDDGALEYKGCPKDQYNTAVHARAQKLKMEILSGQKQSTVTTINHSNVDTKVAQQQRGNSNGM